MFEFIRRNQMDIMLFLCAASAIMAVLLLITRFLPRRRKWILVGMEVIATLLLFFDRYAYIYAGNISSIGYVMVRLSNFIVFFMTPAIVFCFNLYIADLLDSKTSESFVSKRLKFVTFATIIGMLLAVVTVFTGLYYSFDSQNHYHREAGFLIAYIVPVVCPLIQFSVITKYRNLLSRFIYIAMLLYIFVPIIVGVIQIFSYGISIVNMAMVLVSVSLYVFTYLDINDEVQKAHNIELEVFKEEQKKMKSLFSQTATAFATALEKRDKLLEGRSQKTADFALRLAQKCGKSEEVCSEAYYTALLYVAGTGSIPDSLIDKEEDLTEEEEKQIRNLPLESAAILSNIKAFPYLSENIKCIHERFDGKGYPKGIKGNEIPEVARLVAIAEEYTNITCKKRFRNPFPKAIVREEFVKEAGSRFDPVFSKEAVHLIDMETNEHTEIDDEVLQSKITCRKYREAVTTGVQITRNFTDITFNFDSIVAEGALPADSFSAPSIILYDSFDRHVHNSQRAINSYHYMEYGEVWFDGHYISTSARNIEAHVTEKTDSDPAAVNEAAYKISVVRYDDHLLLKLESAQKSVEVILALPDVSKSAYIALTAENGRLYDIKMEVTEKQADENTIPRIAEHISYIDHIESDLPNIQITAPCAEYTKGVAIKDRLKICFHTMSLPEANLVWHCPYIVLYSSEDGTVGGKDYRVYAFIKLNGEDNGSNEYAENSFVMKRTERFENWNTWKEDNKAGYECKIEFEKKGSRIILNTENLGVAIENTTKILEPKGDVFVALTGDQCALTDIRVY